MPTLYKVQGVVENGGQHINTQGLSSTDLALKVFAAATVTVFLTGTTTPASIFSDGTGTPLSNPFTADSTGFWYFFAATATYDIKFSGGGLPAPITRSAVSAGAVLPADVALTDVSNTFSKPQSIIYGSGVASGTTPISITNGDTSRSEVLNNATNSDAIASFTLENNLSHVDGFLLNGSTVGSNLYSGGPPNANLSYWNTDSPNVAINQTSSDGAIWWSTNSVLRAKLSSAAFEIKQPLQVDGATSGSIQHRARAIAGTYKFDWPNTDPEVNDNLSVASFDVGTGIIGIGYQNPAGSAGYDLACTIEGIPGGLQQIYTYPSVRSFTLNLSGSQGVAQTAATAQTDFSVQVNGGQVAVIRFAAAAFVSTVVSSTPTLVSAGDVITIVAPASPDLTLSDISISLDGTNVSTTAYDFGGGVQGLPSASEVVYRFPAVRPCTLVVSGSVGIAQTAATAQTDFDIKVNGVSKGKYRFAIGATVPTIVSPVSAALSPGDIVTIVAPGTPDATLSDITFTLKGTNP